MSLHAITMHCEVQSMYMRINAEKSLFQLDDEIILTVNGIDYHGIIDAHRFLSKHIADTGFENLQLRATDRPKLRVVG